jgi:ech hydrogenase subunit D
MKKIEDQVTTVISIASLIGRVEAFRKGAYRLVQMNCSKIGEQFEINYSFEKDYRFENIRIILTLDTEVPSITGMYWGAFVYENEMHDLYGVQVKGINIDFQGNFIRTSIPYPFRDPSYKGEGPCQGK